MTIKTVLLVDDERIILDVVAQILTHRDYVVIKALCGEQAIDIYKKHHNKIYSIISDVQMPTMTGYEAYNEYLKIDPNFRMIFMSGSPSSVIPELHEDVIHQSVDFMSKPLDFEKLFSLLE